MVRERSSLPKGPAHDCRRLLREAGVPAARCPALPEPHTPCATPAQDVVSLNYWVLKELGHPWTKFSAGFASRPTLLAWGEKNESAARRRFEQRRWQSDLRFLVVAAAAARATLRTDVPHSTVG